MKNLRGTFSIIFILCLISFLFFGRLLETNKYFGIGLASVVLFLLLHAIFSSPAVLDDQDDEPDDLLAVGHFDDKI